MRRLDRGLLIVVVLLIAGSLGLYYWRLNQPVFVRAPFTEAEQEILAALGTDSVIRYRINQRLLSSEDSRYVIDHYQAGQFVRQIPAGGGSTFCQVESQNKLTDVYIGFSQADSGVFPYSLHLGVEGMGSWQRFSAPEHEYIQFIAPKKIALKRDEPMVMALVVFSDQPINVDALTGKAGQSLLEAASQYPDVFAYTLQLVRESR